MAYNREPRIHPVPMSALRPTQITVGMRKVKAKCKAWREHPYRKKADFLGKHMIPVVRGPKDDYYVVDHHHLSLALHQEGVKVIATTIMADLRRLLRTAAGNDTLARRRQPRGSRLRACGIGRTVCAGAHPPRSRCADCHRLRHRGLRLAHDARRCAHRTDCELGCPMRSTRQLSITLPDATESEVIRDGLRALMARDRAVSAKQVRARLAAEHKKATSKV